MGQKARGVNTSEEACKISHVSEKILQERV